MAAFRLHSSGLPALARVANFLLSDRPPQSPRDSFRANPSSKPVLRDICCSYMTGVGEEMVLRHMIFVRSTIISRKQFVRSC